jgi:hypothetical protein
MSSDPTRRPTRSAAHHFARQARVLAACIIAGFGVAASAPIAMAQNQVVEDTRPMPPTPGKKEKPTVFLYYIVLVLLLGLIFGANAVPAKRGHQD